MNDWRSRQRQDQLQLYADTLMELYNAYDEQFRNWMFKQVLPEIRRNGSYTGCEPPSFALLNTVLEFPDDPELTTPTFLLNIVKLLDELRDEIAQGS